MSSKKRSSHSKEENKSVDTSRKIIAFFMFITVFIFSACACGKTVVLNTNVMTDCLTEKEYVQALFLDVQQYAYDLCDECSIPRNAVDDSINANTVSEVNEAYVVGNFCNTEKYSTTTYQDKLEELNVEISKSVSQNLKENKIEFSDSQGENSVNKFAGRITDYLQKIVEIEYASKLQATANVGSAGLVGGMIFSAIMLLILALAEFSIGRKKYRSLRAVSYSFISAGILNFILVLGVEIVKLTKSLVIYPTYFRDAILVFVEKSENSFAIAGLITFVLAIITITIGWRLKRDDR